MPYDRDEIRYQVDRAQGIGQHQQRDHLGRARRVAVPHQLPQGEQARRETRGVGVTDDSAEHGGFMPIVAPDVVRRAAVRVRRSWHRARLAPARTREQRHLHCRIADDFDHDRLVESNGCQRRAANQRRTKWGWTSGHHLIQQWPIFKQTNTDFDFL